MRNRHPDTIGLPKRAIDEAAANVQMDNFLTQELDKEQEKPDTSNNTPDEFVASSGEAEEALAGADTAAEEQGDSWIDQLTVDEPIAPMPEASTQPPVSTVPQALTAEQQAEADLKTAREQGLTKYDNLEHLDPEIALEIEQRIVGPLAKEMAELRRFQKAREEEIAKQRLIAVNTKICEQYPKADKILQSREFAEFVNKQSDPHARETKFELLGRAYYAGDAAYVLRHIDDFVASRGKLKPKVAAEPYKSGGQSVDYGTPKPKKPMTRAEYEQKRAYVKANFSGREQAEALGNLADIYLKGLKQ